MQSSNYVMRSIALSGHLTEISTQKQVGLILTQAMIIQRVNLPNSAGMPETYIVLSAQQRSALASLHEQIKLILEHVPLYDPQLLMLNGPVQWCCGDWITTQHPHGQSAVNPAMVISVIMHSARRGIKFQWSVESRATISLCNMSLDIPYNHFFDKADPFDPNSATISSEQQPEQNAPIEPSKQKIDTDLKNLKKMN